MLTKNAIGNLHNRYKAVIQKCRLINAFGSLLCVGAMLGTLSLFTGHALAAGGTTISGETYQGKKKIAYILADATAQGGAIYNDGTIDSISNSTFTGNYASASASASGSATAQGGAIYNNDTIDSIINSTFTGNSAKASTIARATAQGGAIYTTSNLDFYADDGNIVFKDNYTTTDDGKTKDYNAIYVAAPEGDEVATLTFSMAGTGKIYMYDSITGDAGYSVVIQKENAPVQESGSTAGYDDTGDTAVTGPVDTGYGAVTGSAAAIDKTGSLINADGTSTGSSPMTFYLNAGMTNVGSLDVSNATLRLGSYTHENDSTTYGHISLIGTGGTVSFGENSTFIVDGSYLDYTNDTVETSGTYSAAIDGNDGAYISVDESSSLVLSNVKAGTYTILEGFELDNDDSSTWAQSQVSTESNLFTIESVTYTNDGTDDTYTVSVETNPNYQANIGANDALYGQMLTLASGTGTASYLANGVTSVNSSIPIGEQAAVLENTIVGGSGMTFAAGVLLGVDSALTNIVIASGDFSNAVNPLSIPTPRLNTLNPSTKDPASTYDTSTMTASADTTVSDAHTSYIRQKDIPLPSSQSSPSLWNIWAMPFYQHASTNGIKSGSSTIDGDSDMGGLALGLDRYVGAWRMGIALNAGSGGGSSSDGYVTTNTDFDFWGLSLYAGRHVDKLALMAQVGYSHGDYESVQDLAFLGMENLVSDFTTQTYSASLHASYALNTDFADFAPYVGLRYMHVTMDDYAVAGQITGGHVSSVSVDNQNIWTVPLGITISKDFVHESASGPHWLLTPTLKLGATYAMGDLTAHSTSRVGVYDNRVSSDVLDPWTFDTGLSLVAKKGVATVTLGYDLQVSEHATNHGIFTKIAYEF